MNKQIYFSLSLVFYFFIVCASYAVAQGTFTEIEKLPVYATDKEIINGELWIYQKKYEGHPFWNENRWYNGYVFYKGEKHNGLALRYDVHSNEIIVFYKNQNEARTFKLNKQLLQKFALYDPVLKDTVVFHYLALNQNGSKSIYRKVYDGRCKYYIQYQKSINNMVSEKYTGEYLYAPLLFAKMEGDFVQFSSKADFFSLFGNMKNEIKEFMRKQKIKFKKQSPEDLGIVFQYFDSKIVSASHQ